MPRLWHGRFPSKHPLIPTIDASREASRYVALMPAAIPFRTFWVMISAVVELVGATLIATNTYPRLGGWLIALFLVPVTITVHGVGMVTAPDLEMQRIQTSFFLKGLAMTGGALLITQLGVRRAERDSLRLPRS